MNMISKALKHGTRCRGISRYYLHTHASFTNVMSHAFAFLGSQPKAVVYSVSQKWINSNTRIQHTSTR